MRCKHFLCSLLLLFFLRLHGQAIEVKKLDDHFRNRYEISSLLVKDKYLLCTSERCKEVKLLLKSSYHCGYAKKDYYQLDALSLHSPFLIFKN